MNVRRLFALLALSVASVPAYSQPPAQSSSPAPAPQRPGDPIAAVVNGEIISQHDLEERTRLTLLTSGLADTPDMRSRVVGPLLRRLVDEDLKIQAATKEKITVSATDVAAQMEAIEQNNHMPPGGLVKLLNAKGVEPDALRQQVRGEIAWARLLHLVLIRKVHVSDNAVATRLDAIRANLGKPEYHAAEIFLSLDDTTNEAQVHDLAERLAEQMKQGAPFLAISKQFNQAGGEGDLGWLSEGMMDDELLASLKSLPVNGVTAPIKTTEGYYILTLLEKRKVGEGLGTGATIDLMIIDLNSLASASLAERDLQMQHLRETLAPAQNCDDLTTLSKQAPSASITMMPKLTDNQLPFNVGPLIKDLPPGKISEPIDTQKGRRFFAVCARATGDAVELPSADEIRKRMEDEQLELVARHYVLDLHSYAIVDMRDKSSL